MESLALMFSESLGKYLPAEAVIFIISMIPILELRGGLLVASLLKVDMWKAIPICIAGNIVPIPFILLFIKQIFKWMKNIKLFRPMAEWLEAKAVKKSEGFQKGEFWGLLLFVGIPLPGTGAWTGSLIASLLNFNIKKAVVAILLGLVMATIIMTLLSYTVLGSFLG